MRRMLSTTVIVKAGPTQRELLVAETRADAELILACIQRERPTSEGRARAIEILTNDPWDE